MSKMSSHDVLWHTVDVAWRENDNGEKIDNSFELRLTAGEVKELSEALRDPTATVVVIPRRWRAGDDTNGFFAVGKRSLVTCEARRETEEAWAARHAPPPPPPKYPQTMVGEIRREIDERNERLEAEKCQKV